MSLTYTHYLDLRRQLGRDKNHDFSLNEWNLQSSAYCKYMLDVMHKDLAARAARDPSLDLPDAVGDHW